MSQAPTSPSHGVAFYDHDAELVAHLADFVAEGLRAGEGVVVVATEVHRAALDQVLAQRGVAVDPERYLVVDAHETLACLRDGADLDPGRFAALAGELLDRGAAGGRPVRLFGEVVALLWEAGDVAGALALEELWNALGRERPVTVFCAYPTTVLADGLPSLAGVCSAHTSVVAPSAYDTEVVVLGRPHGASGRTQVFVPVPAAIRMTRRFVTCTLQAWQREDVAADAQLLVSELATNALLHGGSPFQVHLDHDEAGVRVAVADLSTSPPEPQVVDLDRFDGRGVALVEQLSTRWGVDAGVDGGKVVWARLEGAAPLAC